MVHLHSIGIARTGREPEGSEAKHSTDVPFTALVVQYCTCTANGTRIRSRINAQDEVNENEMPFTCRGAQIQLRGDLLRANPICSDLI